MTLCKHSPGSKREREIGRERQREGGRDTGRAREREGGREGGWEGEREGETDRETERQREGGRERERVSFHLQGREVAVLRADDVIAPRCHKPATCGISCGNTYNL